LKESTLRFGIKVCDNGLAKFFFRDVFQDWLFILKIIPSEGQIRFKLRTENSTSLIKVTSYVNCMNFTYFKLRWEDGNVGLWKQEQYMWSSMLNWKVPKSTMDSVTNVTLGSRLKQAEWKIFVISKF